MARVELRATEIDADEEIEIIGVPVTEGMEVEAGAVLVELETDKASLELAAPAAGRVVDLRVAEGDVLSADSVLVIFETA